MDNHNLHLIEWLLVIQKNWELDFRSLAEISHVSETNLKKYLEADFKTLSDIPTLPEELINAMPLVSLFKRIQEEYPDPEAQSIWLKTPNSVFDGHAPLIAIAISPEHLAFVSYVVESGIRLKTHPE